MTHPLMKLPAGYDAWRTRGPDYDDYECTECGGNHVEDVGLYICDRCDGTGVTGADEADCDNCEGDGQLVCETCEWTYWDSERGPA